MTSPAELKLTILNAVDRMPVSPPDSIHKKALREQIESAFETYEQEETNARIANGAVVKNTDSGGNFREEQFIPEKSKVAEPDEPVIQIHVVEKPLLTSTAIDQAVRRRENMQRLGQTEDANHGPSGPEWP